VSGPRGEFFEELMDLARRVRHRMREVEAVLGLTFSLPVRFRTALALIEDGLAEQDWLDMAVGYVMLKELLDEARADQASRN